MQRLLTSHHSLLTQNGNNQPQIKNLETEER